MGKTKLGYVLLLLLSLNYVLLAFADEKVSIKSLLSDNAAVSVIDLEAETEVFGFNSVLPLKPASTLKVLTSVFALKELGPDYNFTTSVFLIAKDKKGLTLGIRGGADPELTTERAYLLARKIKLAGVKNIVKLVLDSTALQDPSSFQGERAYQTASSALSFNFNSRGVQVCPALDGLSKAEVAPLVWEDPAQITNMVSTKKNSAGGAINLSLKGENQIAVDGSIGTETVCTERYLSNPDPVKSFGRAMSTWFEQMQIASSPEISVGKIPGSAEEILRFDSKPLAELLNGLNHFSTNVSAEQILAAIGGEKGSWLSRKAGLEKIGYFVEDLGFGNTKIVDGSGLSHQNRISTKALAKVLLYAWKSAMIRPYLEASLPVLGLSGTLKNRRSPDGDYHVFAKSGTLDGVSALAGYLHTASGKSFSFSIMQNDVADPGMAHRIEEQILKLVANKFG